MSKIINHMKKSWMLPALLVVMGALFGMPLAMKALSQSGGLGLGGAISGTGDQNCANQSTGSPSEPCNDDKKGGGEQPPPPPGECTKCPTTTCPPTGPTPGPPYGPPAPPSEPKAYDPFANSDGCEGTNHFDPYTGNVSRTILDLQL